MSLETADVLIVQSTIHELTTKAKRSKHGQIPYVDRISMDKSMNSDILSKIRSRFRLVFMKLNIELPFLILIWYDCNNIIVNKGLQLRFDYCC